jgi:hypothetical protein
LPAGLRRTAAVALGVSLATSSVPALASLSGAAPTPSTCFTSRRVPLPAAGPSAGGRVVVTADAAIAGLIHAGGPVGGRAGAGRPPTDGTKGVSVDWPLGDAVRRPDDVGRSPVGWPLEPGEVTVSVVEWPLLAGADPSGPRADATVVTAPADRVLVAPGDTLWSIAGRRLGPGAAAPAIAAEWRRWHAANRELIGPDPRRLRPGVVLRVPGTP